MSDEEYNGSCFKMITVEWRMTRNGMRYWLEIVRNGITTRICLTEGEKDMLMKRLNDADERAKENPRGRVE